VPKAADLLVLEGPATGSAPFATAGSLAQFTVRGGRKVEKRSGAARLAKQIGLQGRQRSRPTWR